MWSILCSVNKYIPFYVSFHHRIFRYHKHLILCIHITESESLKNIIPKQVEKNARIKASSRYFPHKIYGTRIQDHAIVTIVEIIFFGKRRTLRHRYIMNASRVIHSFNWLACIKYTWKFPRFEDLCTRSDLCCWRSSYRLADSSDLGFRSLDVWRTLWTRWYHRQPTTGEPAVRTCPTCKWSSSTKCRRPLVQERRSVSCILHRSPPPV